MRKLILFLILSSAILSCKSSYRIDEKNFVNLYADLLIVRELYRGEDSAYVKARDSIYTSYNVNNFMVQKTLEYYNSDPQKWKEFFEKVISRLEEHQTQIRLSN